MMSWHQWLNSYHDKSIKFTLARIQTIATALGVCQFPIPVITVGGTNGKGSTVATLEALLLAQGKRVGAYTSPHLFRFNERVRVNGESVAESSCEQAFTYIYQRFPNLTPQLTFFEFATLIALWIFKHAALDAILLEVGLGGRLDAVNVVDNEVSIITAIDLDHTEYLGTTRAAIAAEKAGIIRAGKFFICGDPEPPEILQQIAKQRAAQAWFVVINADQTISYQNLLQPLAPTQHWPNLAHSSFALQNIASALQALTCLNLLPAAAVIKRVLAGLVLPGRLQRIQLAQLNCEIILDVAHNPHASLWLAERLAALPPVNHTKAIIGIASSKDYAGVLRPHLQLIDSWYPVNINKQNFVTAEVLAAQLRSWEQQQVTVSPAVAAALSACLPQKNDTGRNIRIIVFGSFVTVAAALEFLG